MITSCACSSNSEVLRPVRNENHSLVLQPNRRRGSGNSSNRVWEVFGRSCSSANPSFNATGETREKLQGKRHSNPPVSNRCFGSKSPLKSVLNVQERRMTHSQSSSGVQAVFDNTIRAPVEQKKGLRKCPQQEVFRRSCSSRSVYLGFPPAEVIGYTNYSYWPCVQNGREKV